MATHENEQLLSLPAAKLPARTASEPLTAHLAPSDGAEGGTTTAQTLGEGRSEAQAGGAVRARDFHQQAQPMTLNGEEQGAATPERHDDRDRTSTSNGSLEAAQLAASQEAQLSYHRRRVAQARAQRAVSSAGGLERRGYHENGDDGSDTDGSDGSAGPEQSQQRPELSVSTSKGGQPSPSLLSPPQSAPLGHHPQQPRRRRGESAAIRPGSKLRSAASMPADLNSIAKRQHSPLSPKQGGKRTAMAPLSPSLFPPGFGARGGRSRSASTRSSAPLLPKQLQPFEFVIEPKPAQNQNTSGYDRANGASTSADAQAQQGSAYPYGGQPEASAQGTAMSASAGTFPDVMFHLETKHSGPGMRRIFIGPHMQRAGAQGQRMDSRSHRSPSASPRQSTLTSFITGGAGENQKRAAKARAAREGRRDAYDGEVEDAGEDEDEDSASSSSSSTETLDEDDDLEEDRGGRARARRLLNLTDGSVQRPDGDVGGHVGNGTATSMLGNWFSSHVPVPGGTKKRERANSGAQHQMTRWTGGSFEIGGEIRDAIDRQERERVEAAQRRREQLQAANSPLPPSIPAKAMPRRDRSTSLAHSSSAESIQTFRTARSFLPSFRRRSLSRVHYVESPPDITITDSDAPAPDGLAQRPGIERSASDPPASSPTVPEGSPTMLRSILMNTSSRPRSVSAMPATMGAPSPGLTFANSHQEPPVQDEPGQHSPSARRVSIAPAPIASPAASMQATSATSADGGDEAGAVFAPVPGDEPPLSPEEVLAREGPAAPSKKARQEQRREDAERRREERMSEIIRKERMLVRAEWTMREDLPDVYDEDSSRRFANHLHPEPWEEYGVVWRASRLELYSEPGFTTADAVTGRKKLRHVIPLLPSKTRVSLYSSPDLVFCITHRPTAGLRGGSSGTSLLRRLNDDDDGEELKANKAQRRALLHFRHSGTNIYIVRARSEDIAKHWIWELYLRLGGALPPILEVYVPGLDAKIQIATPGSQQEDEGDTIASTKAPHRPFDGDTVTDIAPRDVIEACLSKLRNLRDFAALVRHAEREGVAFKLVWRRGEILDWIKEDEEPTWRVLSGFALRMPSMETVLELRPALHYPTTCRLPQAKNELPKRLIEPPAIEGYLWRVKASGKLDSIYLSTHDGHLFLNARNAAHPPDPPPPLGDSLNNPAALVLAPFVLGLAGLGSGLERRKRRGLAERWRRGQFMTRQIETIQEDQASSVHRDRESESLQARFERLERRRIFEQIMYARGFVDLRDIDIIEEGVPKEVTPAMRRRQAKKGDAAQEVDPQVLERSFFIRLRNGRITTFECHGPDVMIEWVGRLRALTRYWRRREEQDAVQQMKLQPLNAYQIRRDIRDKSAYELAEERYDDIDATSSPLLAHLFNWCVIDGCRGIIRCGRLFLRKGLTEGIFKERYCIITGGYLLIYQTRWRDMHGQLVDSILRRRVGEIYLRDCYVFAGRLNPSSTTAKSLSFDPVTARRTFPRIYGSDGLMTGDIDDDCTLIIWQKKFASKTFGRDARVRVLKARSMRERDQWLYALNAQIEALQHGREVAREDQLREFEWLR